MNKGEPIMAMDMTYFDAMEAKIPHGKILSLIHI